MVFHHPGGTDKKACQVNSFTPKCVSHINARVKIQVSDSGTNLDYKCSQENIVVKTNKKSTFPFTTNHLYQNHFISLSQVWDVASSFISHFWPQSPAPTAAATPQGHHRHGGSTPRENFPSSHLPTNHRNPATQSPRRPGSGFCAKSVPAPL